jgi:hypothetical protein
MSCVLGGRTRAQEVGEGTWGEQESRLADYGNSERAECNKSLQLSPEVVFWLEEMSSLGFASRY